MNLLSPHQAWPGVTNAAIISQMSRGIGRPRKSPLPEKWPNRIREHRERLGISLAELGRRTGFKPQTIQRYETDERGVSTQKLGRLARSLGLDLPDLLNPEDIQRATEALAPGPTGPLDAEIEDKAMELAILIADAAGPKSPAVRAKLIREALAFAASARQRIEQEADKD